MLLTVYADHSRGLLLTMEVLSLRKLKSLCFPQGNISLTTFAQRDEAQGSAKKQRTFYELPYVIIIIQRISVHNTLKGNKWTFIYLNVGS